ncbi:MAG: DUF1080 domain-containing protein [Bacteroidales bacterium]|nr:DUF1080 domain-containing protein [Bacteroidales bacterium]
MKKVPFLLLLVIIFTDCTHTGKTTDLLVNADRWTGEEPLFIENGAVVLEGPYKTYTYDPGLFKTFENFELSASIMTSPGAKATLIFHTDKKDTGKGYEVRIDNSATGDWNRLLKTGSLSSIRNVYYNMIPDGEWFDLKIKVVENHIFISVNDYPVLDYTEPGMPYRPSNYEKRMLGTGTFTIKTLYKHTTLAINELKVTRLPSADVKKNDNPGFTKKITQLHMRNIPVADFHVHEKGDLTMPLLIERSAKLGINYGIAANCGLKFPIQTDEELEAYLHSIQGLPIFKAMQAEGREWVDMFSPELVNEFDYAFTDAMTWTNRKDKRMRLWIPEETEIGDPGDFMEQLVSQIEKVVTEPIAIYVNPTYLPVEIEDMYDELWTNERIDRVVGALKKNNVALEINSRLKLPGSRVIAKAKEAGVKFAMGTNNTNSENLGNLDWSIEMLEKHDLGPEHMFLPGSK